MSTEARGRSIDVAAARRFLAGHGRLLDRRRFEALNGDGDAEALSCTLEAYRNTDGGYGWGIEPDLRSPESQPTGAMHAFEVMEEIGLEASTRAVELCDWLTASTLPDGGLPFTRPVSDPAGCAPLWLGADPTTSSLQMTAQVAANALRVARRDQRVADHPWLARATGWCVDAIVDIRDTPSAHELLFATRFVDALASIDPERAAPLVDRVAMLLPRDGIVPVQGGAAGEALRALDFAPRPGAVRALFADGVVAAELDRLAGSQQPDGGWKVDFESSSPAAALEWRGYATVAAVTTLSAT
jgi:hypothetical protein